MGLAKDTDLNDGSLRGITGRLERIPLSGAATYTHISGSAGLGSAASSSLNKDGSSNRMVLTTTAVIPSVAVLRDNVYGRVVGVRFLKQNLATAAPFDVIIDGVAYPVDKTVAMRDNLAVSGGDHDALVIVAENLEDTLHTVEVHLAGSATQARRLEIYGWLAESGRGYTSPAPQRVGSVVGGGLALTTVQSGIAYVNLVAGLTFYNSTAADRTVTIQINAQNYQVLTIPSLKSAQIEFPTPRQLIGWSWAADAAGVTGWTECI